MSWKKIVAVNLLGLVTCVLLVSGLVEDWRVMFEQKNLTLLVVGLICYAILFLLAITSVRIIQYFRYRDLK